MVIYVRLDICIEWRTIRSNGMHNFLALKHMRENSECLTHSRYISKNLDVVSRLYIIAHIILSILHVVVLFHQTAKLQTHEMCHCSNGDGDTSCVGVIGVGGNTGPNGILLHSTIPRRISIDKAEWHGSFSLPWEQCGPIG